MKVSNNTLKFYNGSSSGKAVYWYHRFRSLLNSYYPSVLALILLLAWTLRSNYMYQLSSPLLHKNRKQKKLTTNEHRLQYQLEQKFFQTPPHPASTPVLLQSGVTSCPDVAALVQSGAWKDPNDGVVFARRLTSWPPFTVAVHTRAYDHVRWNSIYRRGAYYESEVHERFVQILMESAAVNTEKEKKLPAQVVIDVGMNIGYYTLLSAALGVDRVVAFEINPTNVVRVCESLRLNDWEEQVTILRRGVSDQDDLQLFFHVPRSNPGEAALITKDTKKKVAAPNPKDPSVVTTITLDTLARENHWLSPNARQTISIPILKIDVEGLEPQVLLGATELLQSGLVRNILTEFRHLNSAVAKQAFSLLFAAGYRLVGRNGLLLSLPESERVLHQLALHPLSDASRSTWQKVRSVVLASYITDLWFALPDAPELVR